MQRAQPLRVSRTRACAGTKQKRAAQRISQRRSAVQRGGFSVVGSIKQHLHARLREAARQIVGKACLLGDKPLQDLLLGLGRRVGGDLPRARGTQEVGACSAQRTRVRDTPPGEAQSFPGPRPRRATPGLRLAGGGVQCVTSSEESRGAARLFPLRTSFHAHLHVPQAPSCKRVVQSSEQSLRCMDNHASGRRLRLENVRRCGIRRWRKHGTESNPRRRQCVRPRSDDGRDDARANGRRRAGGAG